MLSSLLADQHVNSVADLRRNLARSDHAWNAMSTFIDMGEPELCSFTAGFLYAAGNWACDYTYTDVWDWASASGCCAVNSTASKERLEIALGFFL